MPAQLLLALAIALMLNEIRFLSSFYRVLFFLPFVTSTIAIAWVFRILYERQGFINTMLEAFSLPTQPFLLSPNQALFSITAMVVWQGLGFAVIIFLAGLKQIPRIYYEAAEIDGATRWQRVRHVVLPHLAPLGVFIGLIQLMDNFRVFEPVVGFNAEANATSLSWIIYNDLRGSDGTTLFSSAAATSMLTIIGVCILLAPVVVRTWRANRRVA